jgi:hypothetical protein
MAARSNAKGVLLLRPALPPSIKGPRGLAYGATFIAATLIIPPVKKQFTLGTIGTVGLQSSSFCVAESHIQGALALALGPHKLGPSHAHGAQTAAQCSCCYGSWNGHLDTAPDA